MKPSDKLVERLNSDLRAERDRTKKLEKVIEEASNYLTRRICDLEDHLNAYPSDTWSQIAKGETRKLWDKLLTLRTEAGLFPRPGVKE
jgi:ribosomal protein S15P/S13E